MRRPIAKILTACLVASPGCAGLETRKVPLHERQVGADHHYDGFRYYLPRAHVLVANRIEISRDYKICELAPITYDNAVGKPLQTLGYIGIQADPTTGLRPIFDLDGKTLARKTDTNAGWTEASAVRMVLATNLAEPVQLSPTLEAAILKTNKDVEQLAAQIEKLKQQPSVPASVAIRMNNDGDTTEGGAVEPSPDNFQIVYMPDFEQQMVVRDRNLLAKSKYDISFTDGWQLSTVQGTWDSTDVPVKILQTIGSAIQAAAGVKEHALNTLPISKNELSRFGKGQALADTDNRVPVLISTIRYIPPGIYKLRKPSEMKDCAAECTGFLTELGIPSQTEHKFQLVDLPQ